MRIAAHRSLLYRLVPVTLITAALAVAPGGAQAQAGAWSVTSSIADGARLAAPVQWSAEPVGTPPGGLDRIEFVIDGSVRWIEHSPPFYFNNDNNYLYPYLFDHGAHQLTVRGVSKRGDRVTATANVLVTQAAPKIPRPLRGTWKHRVSQSVIDRNTAPGDPPIPGGVMRIKWGSNGLAVAFPPPGVDGGNVDFAFSATASGKFEAGGPVNWRTAQSSDDGICHGNKTFGHYRWKVREQVLTLSVVKDPCRIRTAILVGHWKRG